MRKLKIVSSLFFASVLLFSSCKTLRQPKSVPEPLNYSDDDIVASEIKRIDEFLENEPLRALWRAVLLGNQEVIDKCRSAVEEKLAAFVEETKDVLPEKTEEKTVEKAEEKITDVIETLETTTSMYDVRDLYAAAFLCGIAAKIDIRSRRDDYLPDIAERIFDVADAMVKARG